MEFISSKENSLRVLKSLPKNSQRKHPRQSPGRDSPSLCKTIKNRESLTLMAVKKSLKKSRSSGMFLAESPYLDHTFRSRLVKLIKPTNKN